MAKEIFKTLNTQVFDKNTQASKNILKLSLLTHHPLIITNLLQQQYARDATNHVDKTELAHNVMIKP